jgi:hydroxymethylpyrimidine kinase/phosphomethylpyrimidine kinase
VVDPVMVSKHGAQLLELNAIAALKASLLPKAYLVTPNRAEASLLSGVEVFDLATMERAAVNIARLGPPNVLVKGSAIDSEDAIDVLWSDGKFEWFTAPRVDTLHTHGSGCVFSAAITAQLALGSPLREAIRRAKLFVTEAIRSHPRLGQGYGPVNTHADVQ